MLFFRCDLAFNWEKTPRLPTTYLFYERNEERNFTRLTELLPNTFHFVLMSNCMNSLMMLLTIDKLLWTNFTGLAVLLSNIFRLKCPITLITLTIIYKLLRMIQIQCNKFRFKCSLVGFHFQFVACKLRMLRNLFSNMCRIDYQWFANYYECSFT